MEVPHRIMNQYKVTEESGVSLQEDLIGLSTMKNLR